MRKLALSLALTVLLLAPLGQAHGSPTPIEAEDLILEDERTDSGPGLFWSGFDINYVYVREAYFGDDHGVVFRWFLWGGDFDGTDAHHSVELKIDGVSPSLVWETNDHGATWSMGAGQLEGDLSDATPSFCIGDQVQEVEREPDTPAPQGPQPHDVQFQAFVPLCRLGMNLGDSLDNMVATSYAGGERVDVSPGGFYNPNAPDQELFDPANNEARGRVIDSVVLDGPDRYTKSEVTYADGQVHIKVDNLIEAAGQHIFASTNLAGDASAHAHDAEGNDVQGGISANPGQDVEFIIDVDIDDAILVYVDTDLGGREVFTVEGSGMVLEGSESYGGPASNDDAVDTPTVPLALLVVALAAMVIARRR